jgi:pectate lyase
LKLYRIRHGYAHVANNLYMGWVQYAIGGSMEPSLKSQSNLFIAPTTGNKEVIISSNTQSCVIYKMSIICYINCMCVGDMEKK